MDILIMIRTARNVNVITVIQKMVKMFVTRTMGIVYVKLHMVVIIAQSVQMDITSFQNALPAIAIQLIRKIVQYLAMIMDNVCAWKIGQVRRVKHAMLDSLEKIVHLVQKTAIELVHLGMIMEHFSYKKLCDIRPERVPATN